MKFYFLHLSHFSLVVFHQMNPIKFKFHQGHLVKAQKRCQTTLLNFVTSAGNLQHLPLQEDLPQPVPSFVPI